MKKNLKEQKLRKEPTGLERNEKKPAHMAVNPSIVETETEAQYDETFSQFLRSKFTKY